ncbi:kinase-like domain-containing protein [Rhizophagus irregularis DAOM 181602=DAOM 197198]|nr:kinase-like domain-containing protein [Rhizophagus irregularis DAOM 181602=DAOM 197198]
MECNKCKYTQLSIHSDYEVSKALEWIPYDRFYIIKDKFSRTNWNEGPIDKWDDKNLSWRRKDQNMFVILKRLNSPNNIALELKEITVLHKVYGITQDPETKNYMKALEWIPYDRFYDIKYFMEDELGKVYLANWTDGYISYWDNSNCKRYNNNMFVILKSLNNPDAITSEFVDKITMHHKFYGITLDLETKNYMVVLACKKCSHALEWIPYDRLNDIKYIASSNFGNMYGANWIDGYILHWDFNNWERKGQNMFVVLKNLDNLNDITPEFTINEIAINHKVYGITQDPEAKIYMVVCNEICEKCNSSCLATHFHHNFESWTSDDEFGKVYLANWIDGYISYWDSEDHKIGRKGENMFIILKMLNNPNNIASEFANKVMIYQTFYGITQDPETKNYIGNDNINIHIQHTQLSAHSDQLSKVLEWIHYDKLCNVEYLAEDENSKIYQANWIDGYIVSWDDNWKRGGQNMFVSLKTLDNPNDITSEFKNKITIHDRVYGITQDPETKNYMLVLSTLKSLDNSKNVTLEFMNEITWHYKVNDLLHAVIKFYGITQDPITKNYMMVLNYVENGSLRDFLNTSHDKLNWYDRLNCLWIIAYALNLLHKNNLIHRDLHVGNILYDNNTRIYITDMGLCKSADYNASENSKESAYELQKQIEESEGTNKNLSIKSTSLGLSCNTRSEAIYTSGLLNCNSNLPEPKNSDDYYEQNDDIVSMEFTESLQIDISQLKNSDSITSDDYSEYSGSIQINIEDHDSKS